MKELRNLLIYFEIAKERINIFCVCLFRKDAKSARESVGLEFLCLCLSPFRIGYHRTASGLQYTEKHCYINSMNMDKRKACQPECSLSVFATKALTMCWKLNIKVYVNVIFDSTFCIILYPIISRLDVG